MLSHVIPQCLVTDRITIKLQLPGKSRLIFKFIVTLYSVSITIFNFANDQLRCAGFLFLVQSALLGWFGG